MQLFQDHSDEAAEISHTSSPLERIADRYEVRQRVTRGGMGEVLYVFDSVTGRRVALKRLLGEAASDADCQLLFEREFYTLASLKHPCVVEVYDYGIDGAPFYTMELIEGSDLRQLAPMPYREMCLKLRDVASALALLHARQLLHRDVSARNVKVTATGRCKLLDFGALTSFGVAKNIVGTPPCTPPEALYEAPLDQRLDLYALGALAYFLLTGQHAYPARNFASLPDVWEQPLVPPSTFGVAVPEELEQLVLSLLSQDRMERPATAADVIERLNSIAALAPEDIHTVEQSYLLTPALVGRRKPLARLQECLQAATQGHCQTLWIDGGAGIGKTRLIDDAMLSARLDGVIVVRADAELHREPFGVAKAVAEALLRQAPSDAGAAAGADAALLGQLSAAVREALGPEAAADTESAAERRALVQDALQRWLSALCARRPVALYIDNVHAADNASLGFLLGAATNDRGRRLLNVSTQRTGEAPAAEDPLRKLQEQSERIELSNLSAAEVTELSVGLFGDLPNIRIFSEWLATNAGGNPLHSLELARFAIERGIVSYREGAWLLPAELPREAIPGGLEALLVRSVDQLSSQARSLAEALSVHEGAVRLELCGLLSSELTQPGQLFSVLNELVSRGILTSSNDGFRFANSGLRAALLSGLDQSRKRRLHRTIGEALLESSRTDFATSITAGWHLMHAGEETRGADLLARIASADRQLALETDLHAAVPALEEALRVYEMQQRSLYEQAPLLFALVSAAYYVDWRLAHRYGDRAVHVFQELVGLHFARKLRRLLGARLSLVIGILVGWLRFRGAAKRQGTFKGLFIALMSSVTYLTLIALICLDVKTARKRAGVLDPFSVLPDTLAPAGLREYAGGLLLFADNRLGESRRSFIRLLACLKDERRYYRSLTAESRRHFIGAALYTLGVLETFRDTGDQYYVEELERIGSRFYDMVSGRLRITYHAYRGELDSIPRYRERLDVHAVQYGSAWQVETWAPAAMITAHTNLGDAGATKLLIERLKNAPPEMPRLRRHARMTEAYYALLCGNAALAVQIFEELRDGGHMTGYPGAVSTLGALATAYNQLGQYERAKSTCEHGLALLGEQDRDFVVFHLRLEIQLALAEAHLGRTALATEQLEALLARYADRGPVTRTRLHQARAQLALLTGEAEAFRLQVELMGEAARATQSSTLLREWRRLARKQDRASGVLPDDTAVFELHGADTAGNGVHSIELATESDERDEAMTQTFLHDAN